MTERKDDTQLPGSTYIARKAYISTIKGAAAQYFEVPLSMVSAELDESEVPMIVRISSPISSEMLANTPGSLVDSLGGLQNNLRSFLTELLGSEVGTVDLSVTSIHEKVPADEADTSSSRGRRRVI